MCEKQAHSPLSTQANDRQDMNHQTELSGVALDHTGATLTPVSEPIVDAGADTDAATSKFTPAAEPGTTSITPKLPMKRTTLSEAQKYEICVYMKEEEERGLRFTNKSIAGYIHSRYNVKVDESTVSRLRQQARVRLSRDLSNPSCKRRRQVIFPELERLLGEYVDATKRRAVITDPMIINRGKELRIELNIPEDQMKFSDGWLNKFKVRHGLKSAVVHKVPRPSNIPNKRVANISNGTSSSSRSGSNALVPSLKPVELTTPSPLIPTSMPSSTTTVHHEDHHLNLGMDLGSSMDVDNPEPDQGLNMEDVLGPQHSSQAEMNTRAAINTIVSSAAAGDSSISRMELLPNLYGSTLATATAVPAGDQQQQQQQPSSESLAAKSKRVRNRTRKATASQPASQLDAVLPITSTPTVMDTDALTGLGLTATAPHLLPGAGSVTEAPSTKPTVGVTAARASLSLRFADPVAAGFQPEPPVDFLEASQCVNTLRIFMQQQEFNTEQLDHLRDIYLTLDSKRKQQQQ